MKGGPLRQREATSLATGARCPQKQGCVKRQVAGYEDVEMRLDPSHDFEPSREEEEVRRLMV